MKTYAPRCLRGPMLRELLRDAFATPQDVAKFLQVAERSVWRWLANDSAPYAALAALWHETPAGRYSAALDVANELRFVRAERDALKAAHSLTLQRLARLAAISDHGAANDPIRTLA